MGNKFVLYMKLIQSVYYKCLLWYLGIFGTGLLRLNRQMGGKSDTEATDEGEELKQIQRKGESDKITIKIEPYNIYKIFTGLFS